VNKNLIVIALSLLFLIGAIFFSYTQKKSLEQTIKQVKEESLEVKRVATLSALWKGKGIKSKIERIINSISPNKKERFQIKRGKVEIKLNSLTDKELNRVLTKLAMLPLQFKKLQIVKSGDNFILECSCVW